MSESTQHITRHEEPGRGSYQVSVPGSDRLAKLTWRARGNTRIAEHTYTPPEARGHGLARKLVEALVADAREQGFTIDPQCSYVNAQFRRHPEWAELRAQLPS